MDTDLMFSSKSAEWETPQDFFDKLNTVFHFELDPASTDKNAKCPHHNTMNASGLEVPWDVTTFVNPPYGRGITGKWVEKAHREFSLHGKTIVMLLPARTDTGWFQKHCTDAAYLGFVKGRLVFKNIFVEAEWREKVAKGEKTEEQFKKGYPCAAPFPSLLCIFAEELTSEQIKCLEEVGWVHENPSQRVVHAATSGDIHVGCLVRYGSLENERIAGNLTLEEVIVSGVSGQVRASDPATGAVAWRDIPDADN